MSDLSLLFNPIKQYELVPKTTLETGINGLLNPDTGETIYQSGTTTKSIPLILSSGDHVVLDVDLAPISITYSATNNTLKYYANSKEFITITVSSTGLSMKASSNNPRANVTLPSCRIIIV